MLGLTPVSLSKSILMYFIKNDEKLKKLQKMNRILESSLSFHPPSLALNPLNARHAQALDCKSNGGNKRTSQLLIREMSLLWFSRMWQRRVSLPLQQEALADCFWFSL